MNPRTVAEVTGFLQSLISSTPDWPSVLQADPLTGKQQMLDRLLALKKYQRTELPGIVAERHTTAAGIKMLAESMVPIIEALIYALQSSTIVTDILLLKGEPMPGMFPQHPAVRSSCTRTFALIKTPLTPMAHGRVPQLPEHYEVLDPQGPLGLQGIVVEKIDSVDGPPAVRLHLAVYENRLCYYSIDTTGILKMCVFGSAVGMNSFIDMGVFFSREPFDPVLENAYDSIDWRIGFETGEDDSDELESLFHIIPQWAPLIPRIIRGYVELNPRPEALHD